jgi:hypothetical protein
MTNVDYTQKMNELRKRVDNYVILPKNNNSSMILNITKKSYIIYIIIPFGILLFLYILKPSCILYEYKDENDISTYIISIKKLAIVSLILSVIVEIGIYIYKKR